MAPHGDSDNARLIDELGLTDYLRRRFAICGSPDTFLSSIAAAQEAGALNLWFAVRAPDKDRFLRPVGRTRSNLCSSVTPGRPDR